MTDRIVLFVCVENAARSLMAEAYFNARAPEGWGATSAGTEPAGAPNPRTGPMLEEVGLSLPSHPPRRLTPEEAQGAALVITMGCLDRESCPLYLVPQVTEDWKLPDPARTDDRGFREVRDEIGRRVGTLIAQIRSGTVRERTLGSTSRQG
jgi:arsenate reductase